MKRVLSSETMSLLILKVVAQDKTLLLDNPAAALKKAALKRPGSHVQVLSGIKLRKLGLHALPPEECRCESPALHCAAYHTCLACCS